MEQNIDIVLLSLVENRPVLWDITLEKNKNKQANFTALEEICSLLENKEFENLSDKDKNKFGNKIMIK